MENGTKKFRPTPCAEVIGVIKDLNKRFGLRLTSNYLADIEGQIKKTINCGGDLIAPSIKLSEHSALSFDILCGCLAYRLSQVGLFFNPTIYNINYWFVRREPLIEGVVTLELKSGQKRYNSLLVEEIMWFLIINPHFFLEADNPNVAIPGLRYSLEYNSRPIGTICAHLVGKSVNLAPVPFSDLGDCVIPCIAFA